MIVGLVVLIAAWALGLASASNPSTPSADAAGTTLPAPSSASPDASAAATAHVHDHTGAAASGALTDLNGHPILGVKAQDVAAELQPDKPLDRATRATLARQLVVARAVAMKYPTVASATAAGYHVIGGFGPGSGAHYIGGYGGLVGGFDPAKPLSLIYDGTSPTSQIVGLMYYAMGANAPEGFAGPNDHWHRHSNICQTFGGPFGIDVLFPPDSDVTEAQCTAAGGGFMKITGWMVHAWVVPGWESPEGVFSHENPDVRCADGTFNTDAVGRCQGT
jgi:hypothetical protein